MASLAHASHDLRAAARALVRASERQRTEAVAPVLLPGDAVRVTGAVATVAEGAEGVVLSECDGGVIVSFVDDPPARLPKVAVEFVERPEPFDMADELRD